MESYWEVDRAAAQEIYAFLVHVARWVPSHGFHPELLTWLQEVASLAAECHIACEREHELWEAFTTLRMSEARGS
eukprot:10543139-Alexandrium_andersonii.AAC.1